MLSGLTYDTCLCYFDDVIVPSSSLQQHCDRLVSVLSRFRSHNLRVKATKCTFGAASVLFLGHVVSPQGIHTDPKKIEAVSKLPVPQNVEQVRSFLGLSGYYRRFIPKFATLAAPLVALTKKATKFLWTQKQQDAFLSLKEHLCDAPILAYPQLDQPFILQTDASDIGLGAVLTQFDKSGTEHVLSYASRSLSDREKGYSATEKEALAIVFATDHFCPYLLGKKFTVVTDHSALRWLHSIEPKGRIARWVMDLQEYSFDVCHRPGSKNGNADALSRFVPHQNGPSHNDIHAAPVPNCATTVTPNYNFQEAQRKDPHLRTIIELKSADMPKPPLFAWYHEPLLKAFWHCWDSLHMVNGLLVKSSTTKRLLPEYSFVVPSALVEFVLQGIHSSPFSGHLGLKRTILRTKNRFFWPMMRTHISDFVRSCQICAKNKLDSSNNTAPLRHVTVNEPFIFWAMDYIGPMPETSRGNKHLLVLMDHFTKWCEVFPTKDQKACTVADILVTRVFSRFGPPTIIHSDQGRNFESNLMQEICLLMGTHKSRTTAYHPQCDGLVERHNRTIQDMLSSFVADHKDDWDMWVSLVVYAYNTSTHESTGFSPYELIFGRPARTPLELDLQIPLKNPCSQSEYSQSVRQSLQSIKKSAQHNLSSSRFRQKKYYDQRARKWNPHPVGGSVWLRRPKPWKFGGRWIGPFQIISRQGVNYKIRSMEGKDKVVHHNSLKTCVVPVDKGVPFCAVPESAETQILVGDSIIPGENILEGRGNEQPPRVRTARLRQNVNPPLRFGEVVTH